MKKHDFYIIISVLYLPLMAVRHQITTFQSEQMHQLIFVSLQITPSKILDILQIKTELDSCNHQVYYKACKKSLKITNG
jgi:hypothetical protein